MKQFKDMTIEALEKTYETLFAKPTIDMTAVEIESRGETVHHLSLTLLKMETASMQKLHEAMASTGGEMQKALSILENASTESENYLTTVQAVDQALQIISSTLLFML